MQQRNETHVRTGFSSSSSSSPREPGMMIFFFFFLPIIISSRVLLHDFLVAAAVGQLGDLTRQSAGRRRS
jgi:hypothetical protein